MSDVVFAVINFLCNVVIVVLLYRIHQNDSGMVKEIHAIMKAIEEKEKHR